MEDWKVEVSVAGGELFRVMRREMIVAAITSSNNVRRCRVQDGRFLDAGCVGVVLSSCFSKNVSCSSSESRALISMAGCFLSSSKSE